MTSFWDCLGPVPNTHTPAADFEVAVTEEITKYAAISAADQAQGSSSRFYDRRTRVFDVSAFWYEHRFDLPKH